VFIQLLLVESARLAVHADQERLVAERLDVGFEMLGDELGDRGKAVVGLQERL